MPNRYAIYHLRGNVGEIAMFATGDDIDAEAQCDESLSYGRVANDVKQATHYVNIETGKANQRPTTPCTPSKLTVEADGSDTVTLSQMRDGTRLQVSGPVSAELTVNGDNATQKFTATTPGDYQFEAIGPWPARPKRFVIYAV